MVINIGDSNLKRKIKKKLKEKFRFIKLDKSYSVHFALIQDKEYEISLKTEKSIKSLFVRSDKFHSKKGFKNFDYNIALLINFIDTHYILRDFYSPSSDDVYNSKFRSESAFYGYDGNRVNDDLLKIYSNFEEMIVTGEVNVKNYNYNKSHHMYFEFYGNKVRLIIEKNNSMMVSPFFYFNTEEITVGNLHSIIEKMDNSLEKKEYE